MFSPLTINYNSEIEMNAMHDLDIHISGITYQGFYIG